MSDSIGVTVDGHLSGHYTDWRAAFEIAIDNPKSEVIGYVTYGGEVRKVVLSVQPSTVVRTTKMSKTEYGEYRVRLFVNGAYQPDADYFTEDKEDAYSTAKHMRGDS